MQPPPLQPRPLLCRVDSAVAVAAAVDRCCSFSSSVRCSSTRWNMSRGSAAATRSNRSRECRRQTLFIKRKKEGRGAAEDSIRFVRQNCDGIHHTSYIHKHNYNCNSFEIYLRSSSSGRTVSGRRGTVSKRSFLASGESLTRRCSPCVPRARRRRLRRRRRARY